MKLAQKVVLYFIRSKISLYGIMHKAGAAQYVFKLFCTPFVRVNIKMPSVFEDAKKIHFVYEGFTIKGFEYGAPSQKKLLIIHGWESSCYRFEQYVKPIAAMGIQIFCFDAIAHGQSEGKQLNVYQYAKLIAYMHYKYGGFTHYIAHSLGAAALCISLSYFKPAVQVVTPKIVLFAPATNLAYFFNTFYKKLRVDKAIQLEIDKLVYKLSGFPIAWFNINKHLDNIRADILWFHDKDDDACLFIFVNDIIEEHRLNIKFHISTTLGHSGVYKNNKHKKLVFDFFR
jgi:pimeloyl-ACP methyl ester carboxylesterase